MNIGDRVCNRHTGSNAGVIGDMTEVIAFVDMDNGVEMELRLSDLILAVDYVPPQQEMDTMVAAELEAQNDLAQTVIDSLGEGLIKFGQIQHESASMAVIALGGSATKWDSLTALQQLNFVSIVTGISTKEWIEANVDGKLTSFKFMALAYIGKKMSGMIE